ncbi:MAG: hypothetical protein ACKOA8_09680 [Deltaproteobacteria bacterium]
MKLPAKMIAAGLIFIFTTGMADPQVPFVSPANPKLCAAVRGNGAHLMAHFGGLAALTENYGLVDGISGGSSASISVFFYESMIANPALWNCGDHRCSEDEVRPRLSHMLKSILGAVDATIDLAGGRQVIESFGKSSGSQGQMAQVMDFLKNGFQNPGRGPLRRRLVQRIADRVVHTKLGEFEGTSFGRMINEKHRETLNAYGLSVPPYKRWEILMATQGFDFSTGSKSIFFREGLMNYEQLVNIIGRVGDFFSNRGPLAQNFWQNVLSKNCLEAARGLSWKEMRQSQVGSSCSSYFENGFKNYIRNTLAMNYRSSRLQEPVGKYLNSLISNSVIVGDGVRKYNEGYGTYRHIVDHGPSYSSYQNGFPQFRAALNQIPFSLNFLEDVRFGYWGRESALKDVEAKTSLRRDDAKSSLFINLGTPSWNYILHRSPAEPGLSKMVPMGNQMISSGGWSDLHPIPVLKDMGCEKVVYLTRTNSVDSEYGEGIAKLFNIPQDMQQRLFDINNPEASCSKSLKAADAVVCSHWNSLSPIDFHGHFSDSYRAPVATEDSEFKAKSPNLLSSPLPGCVAPG